MPLLNSIISWVNVKRLHQIELFKKYPFDVQQEVFTKLVDQASKTTWGFNMDMNPSIPLKIINNGYPSAPTKILNHISTG